MVQAVEFTLSVVTAYALLGFVVAVALHLGGLRGIDPATRGAGFFFRALITPGMIALWPILLHKWVRARSGHNPLGEPDRPIRPNTLRMVHGLAFKTLVAILPILFAAGILARAGITLQAQTWPDAPSELEMRSAAEGNKSETHENLARH
ncbi:MAG: hypothetical protein HUU16_09520 [Candidatus Omnitrophica bacterium]|nr:hypothetical protein [bacterium]NUN96400.1 hypothetical protein [Candidatus Omnitrophota bacterium]